MPDEKFEKYFGRPRNDKLYLKSLLTQENRRISTIEAMTPSPINNKIKKDEKKK